MRRLDPEKAKVFIAGDGSLVIPATFLKAAGIEPGQDVVLHIHIQEGELRVTTAMSRLRQAQKIVHKYVDPSVSLVDELIAERRRQAARE